MRCARSGARTFPMTPSDTHLGEGEGPSSKQALLETVAALESEVIAFRRHGVRASARNWPVATPQERDDWCEVLRDAGVRDLVLV